MGMTVKELTEFLEQEDTAAAGQRDQSPGSGMRGNMIELKNVSKSF